MPGIEPYLVTLIDLNPGDKKKMAKPMKLGEKALTQAAKAGWVVPPGDPVGAASALKVIAANPRENLRAAGARGLDYALCHLTREANLSTMIRLLLQLAKPGPPSTALNTVKSGVS